MKSLVRVLPAAAYTFNTVPICDPGGPNPHGLVWETFPAPVRDFTPRLHYSRETGFPKPDFRSRTSEAGLWSGAGLTRNWAISQFVSKYTVLFLEPIRSLLDPSRVSHTIIGTTDSSRLTSEAGLPKPDSLGIGLSPNSSPNTRSYSLNQSVHY